MNAILRSVLLSVVAAWSPLGIFTALLFINPGLPPGPFWMVPIGLVFGYSVLWRRYPANAYPIGLVFVPLMGAALLYGASLVAWHIVGAYI